MNVFRLSLRKEIVLSLSENDQQKLTEMLLRPYVTTNWTLKNQVCNVVSIAIVLVGARVNKFCVGGCKGQ